MYRGSSVVYKAINLAMGEINNSVFIILIIIKLKHSIKYSIIPSYHSTHIICKCSNSYCIRRWSQLRCRHYKSSVRHKYTLLSWHLALDHTPSLHAWFAVTRRQLLNYRDTSMCLLQSVLQLNFINYLTKTHTWNYKEVLEYVIIRIETAVCIIDQVTK